jgi:hypothetical protein
MHTYKHTYKHTDTEQMDFLGMDNMIYLYKNIIEEWSHVEEFKSVSSSYITSLAVMIVPSTSSSSNIG